MTAYHNCESPNIGDVSVFQNNYKLWSPKEYLIYVLNITKIAKMSTSTSDGRSARKIIFTADVQAAIDQVKLVPIGYQSKPFSYFH